MEHLVRALTGGLDKGDGREKSHALLKICGVPLSRGGLCRRLRQGPAAEDGIHIRLELDLQVVLIDLDLPQDEL